MNTNSNTDSGLSAVMGVIILVAVMISIFAGTIIFVQLYVNDDFVYVSSSELSHHINETVRTTVRPIKLLSSEDINISVYECESDVIAVFNDTVPIFQTYTVIGTVNIQNDSVVIFVQKIVTLKN